MAGVNASSSRVALRYYPEDSWAGATTPASNPVLIPVRRVPGGGGLQRNSQVVSSGETDASRTIPDQVETGYAAAFDYNWELAAGAHDDFFRAMLGGTTFKNVGASLSGSFSVVSGASQAIHRAAGDWAADGLLPGMWIKVAGFVASPDPVTGIPRNNGIMRINDTAGSVTATDLFIDDDTKALVTEGALTATIKFNMTRTGTTQQQSFLVEEHFTDITTPTAVYMLGRGFRPTRMQLTATAGAIVTGSLNFLGKTVVQATAPLSAVAPATVGTTQSMNATSNVGTLYEGGAAITSLCRQATINVNPNVTELRAISNAAAAGLIDGTFDITVALNLYFDSLTYMNKVIARTPTSLMLPFMDAAGNAVIFSFPKGYLSGTPKEQGQNQPVAQDLTFTAVRYTGYAATPSIMMQIDTLI